MLVFWHDCHKLSLVTAPLHGLDRDNWKKKRWGGTAETMKTIFPPAFQHSQYKHFFALFCDHMWSQVYMKVIWTIIIFSYCEMTRPMCHLHGWERRTIIFFFQELYISVSKRREKREWNISQTVFLWYISDFDIQKEWVSVWLHGTITRKTFHSYLR